MRVHPHLLTQARNSLVEAGRVVRVERSLPWYHLADAKPSLVKRRLQVQETVLHAMQQRDHILRLGQTLEIATYRALLAQTDLRSMGGFPDLDQHGDDRLYSKEEPPGSLSGRSIGKSRLDFMVIHSTGIIAGIEAKNVREWMYPDRDEVKDLLWKCVTLDVVPVLIARRIPFVSFKLLYRCGVIVHQTYNQLFPESDRALAEKVKNKTNLGYHDVRIGNKPDERLSRFIVENLPAILPAAGERFDAFKDLIEGFVKGDHDYKSLAARVRRRLSGLDENFDAPEEPYYGAPEE
jgi:hypothetical protein